MKILGVYQKLPKKVWTEIAKTLKEDGEVLISMVSVRANWRPIEIKYAVIAVPKESHFQYEKDKDRLEEVLTKKERVSSIRMLEDREPELLMKIHFTMKANAIQSQAILRVGEALRLEYEPYLMARINQYRLVTEDGVLGVIGRLVYLVSHKIARDTYNIQYSQFILGEMRVTNTSLMKTHPLNKMYEHSVAIGAGDFGDFLTVGISKGDDTEKGLSGQYTYESYDFDPKTFPINDLKNGNYNSQEFYEILDLVFKILILSSMEGYNEFSQYYPEGVPYGMADQYSWLTLKDGTKVTLENYNFQELYNKLNQ